MLTHPRAPVAEPELLRPREAARLLAIGERSLWALTKAGKIAAVRLLGRTVRYHRRDIDAFIEAAKQPVVPQ